MKDILDFLGDHYIIALFVIVATTSGIAEIVGAFRGKL